MSTGPRRARCLSCSARPRRHTAGVALARTFGLAIHGLLTLTSASEHPIVLGIAERAAYVPDAHASVGKWNVLGLRQMVLGHVFPMPLPDWSLAIAFRGDSIRQARRFVLVDDAGTELGRLDLSVTLSDSQEVVPESKSGAVKMLTSMAGWNLLFLPIRQSGMVLRGPGPVAVHLDDKTGPKLGVLHFALLEPPPFDASRINAIRSDPAAAKTLWVEYGCKQCPSKIRLYAALERSRTLEAEGAVWFADAPMHFDCTCGKTSLSLEIVRRNLHGLLGSSLSKSDGLAFTPLYEHAALSALREHSRRLIHGSTSEEIIQKHIEANPILLHQFAAVRIFHKPAILTNFVADFALLTPKRELLLVEIERAATRLMTKAGDMAAPLKHAFDQVRTWLHVADEHRLAMLDALALSRDDVGMIRGVVIAGRDQGYDGLHLRRLKSQDFGRISFYTYDDVLFALDALVNRVRTV